MVFADGKFCVDDVVKSFPRPEKIVGSSSTFAFEDARSVLRAPRHDALCRSLLILTSQDILWRSLAYPPINYQGNALATFKTRGASQLTMKKRGYVLEWSCHVRGVDSTQL